MHSQASNEHLKSTARAIRRYLARELRVATTNAQALELATRLLNPPTERKPPRRRLTHAAPVRTWEDLAKALLALPPAARQRDIILLDGRERDFYSASALVLEGEVAHPDFHDGTFAANQPVLVVNDDSQDGVASQIALPPIAVVFEWLSRGEVRGSAPALWNAESRMVTVPGGEDAAVRNRLALMQIRLHDDQTLEVTESGLYPDAWDISSRQQEKVEHILQPYRRWQSESAADRVAMQFEVNCRKPARLAALHCRNRGVYAAMIYLNQAFDAGIRLGGSIAYSETRGGFWNERCGWLRSKAAASGYDQVPTIPHVSDLELVEYESAQDIEEDELVTQAQSFMAAKVRGPMLSRFAWQLRYAQLCTEIGARVSEAFSNVELLCKEVGWKTEAGYPNDDHHSVGRYVSLPAAHDNPFALPRCVCLVFELHDGLTKHGIRAAKARLFIQDVRTASVARELTHDYAERLSFATETGQFLHDSSWLESRMLFENIRRVLLQAAP